MSGQIMRVMSSEVRSYNSLGDDGELNLVNEVHEFTLARKTAR